MTVYMVSFSIVDSMNRKGRKVYETQDLLDEATGLAAANAMAIALDDVSEMRILSFTLSQRVVYADSVEAGANRDEGATVTVRKVDNQDAAHSIPAPVQSLRLADGTVDLTDVNLIAYFDQFKAAGDFTLSDGELITEVVRGTIDL